MKRVLAIVLFVAVLFQSMSKLVVIINYQIHKDYVAKNLCENRDKPKMCCKGKCQLKKQLNKTENEGTRNKTSQRFTFDDYVNVESNVLSVHTIPLAIVVKTFPVRTQDYSFDPLLSIFHPPRA